MGPKILSWNRISVGMWSRGFAKPRVRHDQPGLMADHIIDLLGLLPYSTNQYFIIMKLLKSHPILSIANSFVIDSPSPSNLSYLWNYGSLLGLCLVMQIITGVTLAMHYCPSIDFAFLSVEHIVRDVNYGWLIRYLHANVASFFFAFVYLHIGKGLYYGSYKSPRILL